MVAHIYMISVNQAASMILTLSRIKNVLLYKGVNNMRLIPDDVKPTKGGYCNGLHYDANDTIDLTDAEWDEIFGNWVKDSFEPLPEGVWYKTNPIYIKLSRYLRDLVELYRWGQGCCPHGIGDFHDKDQPVTLCMRKDCPECMAELKGDK
jgi:hypothetical protein